MSGSNPRHVLARRMLGTARVVLPSVMLLATALGFLLASASPAAAQLVTQPGPDGTPQFDRSIERRLFQSS